MCYGMHCEWEDLWGQCTKPVYEICPFSEDQEDQEEDEDEDLEDQTDR